MPTLRVLIIDDEVALLRVLRRALSSRYLVEVAETGRAALELLRSSDFDAIVCDLHLEDMHGMAIFETASRERPELRNRFVFSSGGSVNGNDLAFLGTVTSIAKPCTAEAVAAMIDLVGRAPGAVTVTVPG